MLSGIDARTRNSGTGSVSPIVVYLWNQNHELRSVIDAQDSPPHSCGVNYTRDCTDRGVPGCIVSAITNLVGALHRHAELPKVHGNEVLSVLTPI